MSGPTPSDERDTELFTALQALPVPVPPMPALRRREPAGQWNWVLYASILAAVVSTIGLGLDRAVDARVSAELVDAVAGGLAGSGTGAALIALASGVLGGAVTLVAGGRGFGNADGVRER